MSDESELWYCVLAGLCVVQCGGCGKFQRQATPGQPMIYFSDAHRFATANAVAQNLAEVSQCLTLSLSHGARHVTVGRGALRASHGRLICEAHHFLPIYFRSVHSMVS